MKNPWSARNPFMSAWLSMANTAAGHMRAQATAEIKRQVRSATRKAASSTGTASAAGRATRRKTKRTGWPY